MSVTSDGTGSDGRSLDGPTRVSVLDGPSGSLGNGSWFPVMSGDGRYIAFESIESIEVAHDSNSNYDNFRYDFGP